MVGAASYSLRRLAFEEILTFASLVIFAKIESQVSRTEKVKIPINISKSCVMLFLNLHGIAKITTETLSPILMKLQFHFPAWIDIAKKYVKIFSLEVMSEFMIKNIFSALMLKGPYAARPHLHIFCQTFHNVLQRTKVLHTLHCQCPCHLVPEFKHIENSRDSYVNKELRERQFQEILEGKEEYFDLVEHAVKGRCVMTKRFYSRGEPILEYKGRLLSSDEANRIHCSLQNTSSYIAWFHFEGSHLAIDATEDVPGQYGRLLNHAFKGYKENCSYRVLKHNGLPRVIFTAKRMILPGEELCWNYNENNRQTILQNPWLRSKETPKKEICCDFDFQIAAKDSERRDMLCQDICINAIDGIQQLKFCHQIKKIAEEESHKYYRMHRKRRKMSQKKFASNDARMTASVK